MTITYTHVAIVAVAAFATVALLLFTAPTLRAGRNRLALLMNTLGVIVATVSGIGGVALLAYGFINKDEELIYISLMPLVVSGATWNFITRRHRTWWGWLGANDSRERSKSFWRETASLWRGRDPDAQDAKPPRPQASPGVAPDDARSFSFSFNLGGSSPALGSLLRFGAHRLSTDPVSAFPSVLEFTIVSDGDPALDRQLEAVRQEVTIRRQDGGTLDLHATTDLDFLTLQLSGPSVDGTYTLAVGFRAGRRPRDSFAGTIAIETGEPAQPTLAIAVSGEVRVS